MPTLTWTGAGDGTTFTSAGNWSGGTPSNNDTLVVNSTSAAIAGAATGLTGITLKIGSGFTGTIGSSTTYLDLDGPECLFSSGGTAHYLTGTWTDFRITGGTPSPTLLDLKGNASTVITNLYSTRLNGTATINSSASVTNVFATGLRAGTLDIKSGVSSLASMTVGNANVLLASSVSGTVEVFDGQLTTTGTAALTTLEIDGDGLVRHNASGTIGTLTVFDGTIDASENESTTFTITNASVHVGGILGFDTPLNNGVFTNPVEMLGGDIRVPVGSTILIA
jgi:hypothetical protein